MFSLEPTLIFVLETALGGMAGDFAKAKADKPDFQELNSMVAAMRSLQNSPQTALTLEELLAFRMPMVHSACWKVTASQVMPGISALCRLTVALRS